MGKDNTSAIILPYLAAARACGDDAGSFLQGQLTADLDSFAGHQARFSGYCDPKGNTLAVMRVIRNHDGYRLIAARDLMDSLLSRLRRYVLRARVSLEACENPVVGIRTGSGPDYGLAASGSAPGRTTPADLESWRADELRAGIVWLGSTTSGRYLPQMLGLERLGALSFRKGCFPGQEVIARVRYLGRLKQRPLIAIADSHVDARAGDEAELLDETGSSTVAEVIDAARSGNSTVLFLVARIDEGFRPATLESGGRRAALVEVNQAWATM